MSQDDYYTRSRKPVIPMPTTRRGKIGCGAALVVWFCILLLPCAMFWLASGGAFIIPGTGLPEPVSHPRLEIRLISEADYSGLQITRSSVASQQDNNLCVYTDVTYALWTNREGDNPSVAYCDCYERATPDSQWVYTGADRSRCEG